MKQVLIVGAGHHSPKGPISFLHSMQEQEPVHAKGLFFRPVDYAAIATGTRGANTIPVLELEDNEIEPTLSTSKAPAWDYISSGAIWTCCTEGPA